jgi:hypothetical protein
LITIVHKRKTMIVEYINSRSRHAEFDESLTGIGVYNMFDALYLSLLEVKKHGGYAGYRPNVVILFGGKFEKLYKTSDDEEGHHILTTQLAPWMSMVMHVNRVAAAGCDVRIVLTGRGGYSDKAVEEYASELMKCSGMKQKGVELVRKKEQGDASEEILRTADACMTVPPASTHTHDEDAETLERRRKCVLLPSLPLPTPLLQRHKRKKDEGAVREIHVFMSDSIVEIERKFARAAVCPTAPDIDASNKDTVTQTSSSSSCVEYVERIIFPWYGNFVVGETEYETFDGFLQDFQDRDNGFIRPNDLKTGLARAVNSMLDPVRHHFAHASTGDDDVINGMRRLRTSSS